jgi:hypothetical protein
MTSKSKVHTLGYFLCFPYTSGHDASSHIIAPHWAHKSSTMGLSPSERKEARFPKPETPYLLPAEQHVDGYGGHGTAQEEVLLARAKP